tara:strand:- start:350 stop:1366 length:1017 start_codon:yes stop_codon:yes gene_type:complete
MSNARKLADNLPKEGQFGGRNILINGQMTIAQRNTAAHNEGSGYFCIDRWAQNKANTDQFTYSVEQVSDAPSGFSKSLKVTTSTAETAVAADEYARIYQAIEGNNLARVGFGTADAKQLTLSFWVKSSITGNFSASLYLNDTNKIDGRAYTINSANTWEYKTITYNALTSGGPTIDNTYGAIINFGLFSGSSHNTATTDWTAYGSGANLLGGQTANLGGTLNATWQITGCQLEIGSQSTPFEHEPVSVSLAKCQRYFYKDSSSSHGPFATQYVNTHRFMHRFHPVEMRATPTSTVTYGGGSNGTEYNSSSLHFKSYLAAAYDATSQHYITAYQADAEL